MVALKIEEEECLLLNDRTADCAAPLFTLVLGPRLFGAVGKETVGVEPWAPGGQVPGSDLGRLDTAFRPTLPLPAPTVPRERTSG